MTAPDDSRVTDEWGEKILAAIAGGYQPGQRISEKMGFASKETVSEVIACYKHSVVGTALITAHGVPALERRIGAYNFYTVELYGLIKDGQIPGRYKPFRVRFRIEGRCNEYFVLRSALNPFDVIKPSPIC